MADTEEARAEEPLPFLRDPLQTNEEETKLPSLTMAPAKPSQSQYQTLVIGFVLYSIIVGYYSATRPNNKFRSPFSWHPLLMLIGFVGCFGIAAITKKLGGYTNTKNHGTIAMIGSISSLCGLYAIYHNKNLMDRPHFTSYHGKLGLALVVSSVGIGLAGLGFLHPDYGIDKTNKTIRFVHKSSARFILGLGWVTAFLGLYTMTQNLIDLAMFGLPLLVFAPFTIL